MAGTVVSYENDAGVGCVSSPSITAALDQVAGEPASIICSSARALVTFQTLGYFVQVRDAVRVESEVSGDSIRLAFGDSIRWPV